MTTESTSSPNDAKTGLRFARSKALTVAGNTAITKPENRAFYPALDGLRACAVLMVFEHHYIQTAFAGTWQWGWAGVNVFFVLSGFLITGILWDTRDSEGRLRNFYVRRFLRIFPLFYGVFLLLLLSTPFLHWDWTPAWFAWPLYFGNFLGLFHFPAGQESVRYGTLASSATFMGNRFYILLGHFWSLAIEEQFYIVFPWIVFVVKDRVKLRNLFLAAIIAVVALRTLIVRFAPASTLERSLLHVLTPFQVDSLLIGAVLAIALRGDERRFLKRLVYCLTPVCSVLLIIMPLVGSKLWPGSTGVDSPWMASVGFTVIDILSACAIWIALQPGSIVFDLLTLEPLRELGRISYGFYVFHDIPHLLFVLLAIKMVGEGAGAYIAAAAMAFTCTAFLSWLSFRFYESLFLRLKERFAPSPDLALNVPLLIVDEPVL